jgi:hypothetical protein
MRLALLAVLLATSAASAEGLAPYESVQKESPPVERQWAVAINEPLGWTNGFAVAGSIYGRVAPHQAVRINAARYGFHGNLAGDVINIVAGGDGARHTGRLIDVGAGWVYFPRRVFDGPSIELGMLHRTLDARVEAEWETPGDVSRDGQEIAAHALLGWSWTIRNRVFISFAMGASKGYVWGSETTREMAFPTEPQTPMTHHFAEWTTGFEGYLRFGVAFGQ